VLWPVSRNSLGKVMLCHFMTNDMINMIMVETKHMSGVKVGSVCFESQLESGEQGSQNSVECYWPLHWHPVPNVDEPASSEWEHWE